MSLGKPEAQAVEVASAGAHPDAELIAACAAFDALERKCNATFGGPDRTLEEDLRADEERNSIYVAQEPHLDRIMELRATTIDGFRAKARSLALEDLELLKDGPGDRRDCLIASLVQDLIREAA